MDEVRHDRRAVLVIAAVIITNALLFLYARGQTYVHIDAIAHVNKARGLFDNFTPGLKQLGSIWLPLQHLLIAPLTWFDFLWSSGLAGSILSGACFAGTAWFLFSTTYVWTGVRAAAWVAFLLFALNPRMIYLFTTPMTEPLMILCAAGLMFYLVCWSQDRTWRSFGLAALFVFAGTLTRYEGWALAAASILLVFLVSQRQRAVSTILFAGAAVAGPMLWMIFNMVYFEDPLIFTWGRGSARDYAFESFLRTGKEFPSAGNWIESFTTYFVDVAYCLNPIVLWLGVGGLLFLWARWSRGQWRTSLIIAVLALVPFAFYVFNLYSNMVPIIMPGRVPDQMGSIYNVRYGAVPAAAVPVLAASLIEWILWQSVRQRAFSLLLIATIMLPDPIPEVSLERGDEQLTDNLLYEEGVHNQSFWMPAFVDVAKALKADIERLHDDAGLVLTNSRVVHPAVWATAIPMKRFIHEMNKDRWDANISHIDSGIRWVITEEGDQLWHAQGKVLEQQFDEVAQAKSPSTGIVHLYRRK